MSKGLLGTIATPKQGNKLDDLPILAFDNGCFGKGYIGDVPYIRWLAERQHVASRVRFAVAPDVVGDAKATEKRSAPFLPIIRALGYPAAFVAQDGLERRQPPWDDFDVLFIGGTTDWKLGPHARALAGEVRSRGKWVHLGRGNTRCRLRLADEIGCDSADGTTLTRGPDKNLPQMLTWLRELNHQGTLWGPLPCEDRLTKGLVRVPPAAGPRGHDKTGSEGK